MQVRGQMQVHVQLLSHGAHTIADVRGQHRIFAGQNGYGSVDIILIFIILVCVIAIAWKLVLPSSW